MKKVIFILGTGHCGSTLLDLILGSHTKMFSLGEVYRVVSSSPPVPICDICDEDCEFWKPELLKSIQSLYTDNLPKQIGRKLGVLEAIEVSFYRKLFEASRNNILVDSSKNPGWISRNERKLRASNIEPVLIYLSRDGRAVVNSYYRKYPERGLEGISHNWNSRITAINKCFDSWPSDNKIHIRYEDLAKNPITTIKKLMEFIQLPFEEEMMRFWEHDHHLVNGNAGTKSMLLKFKDTHKHKQWVETNDKEYYREKELGITFDARWRRELSLDQIAIIESITDSLNNPLKEDDQ
ncbi:MAG: sulfotransferase [Aequorivita sp.]